MSHHCHARNCGIQVPPEMLMCRKHWFTVPKKIRDDVWTHYRRGQCNDKQFTDEWLRAADAAIGFVARKEGLGLRQAEVNALKHYGL